MKLKGILGQRIVGITQQRVMARQGDSSININITEITLEDGTRLFPNVQETDWDFYTVDFVVNTEKKKARKRG